MTFTTLGPWLAIIAAVFAGLASLLNVWGQIRLNTQVRAVADKADDIAVKTTKAVATGQENAAKLEDIGKKTDKTAVDAAVKMAEIHSQGNSNWDKTMKLLTDARDEISSLRERSMVDARDEIASLRDSIRRMQERLDSQLIQKVAAPPPLVVVTPQAVAPTLPTPPPMPVDLMGSSDK